MFIYLFIIVKHLFFYDLFSLDSLVFVLRLCLVRVKAFPENISFSGNAIFRKGKCFHVFGCISKNFPKNIFWCLEKKKEYTNPEKHKPQPRKKNHQRSTLDWVRRRGASRAPVRRPRRRSQSEIDASRDRAVDHEIAPSITISRRR